MLGRAFTEYAYLPASSTRGGILLIAGRQADVSFSDVLDGQSKWWLTSVYGPQDDGDKAVFLEELEAIRDACAGPWAITGDFNLILNEADKSNERKDRTNLRRFRQTVATLELQDMHLHGRCFTWSNERERPTLVRLDRVLISVDWDEKFPNAHLHGLGCDASYHCPLLLQTNMGHMTKVLGFSPTSCSDGGRAQHIRRENPHLSG